MGHLNIARVYADWGHLDNEAHRLLTFMAHVSVDRHNPPVARLQSHHLLHALGRPAPHALDRLNAALTRLQYAGAIVQGLPPVRTLSAEWALTLDPTLTASAAGTYVNEHGKPCSHWYVHPRTEQEVAA